MSPMGDRPTLYHNTDTFCAGPTEAQSLLAAGAYGLEIVCAYTLHVTLQQ